MRAALTDFKASISEMNFWISDLNINLYVPYLFFKILQIRNIARILQLKTIL